MLQSKEYDALYNSAVEALQDLYRFYPVSLPISVLMVEEVLVEFIRLYEQEQKNWLSSLQDAL